MRIILSILVATLSMVMGTSAATLTSLLRVPTATPSTVPYVVRITTPISDSSWIPLGNLPPTGTEKCVQDGGYIYKPMTTEYCVFSHPFQMINKIDYYRGAVTRFVRLN